jgi:hypothetical protein
MGRLSKMGEGEREEMLAALKDEWESVNREYQRLCFRIDHLDTVRKVRSKEDAERRLAQLERMIASLGHKHVFVQGL